MNRTLLCVATGTLIFAAFGLGALTERHFSAYPRMTIDGGVDNAKDIERVVRECGVVAVWHVRLNPAEPMDLEQRRCPADLLLSGDGDEAEFRRHFKSSREVLLLERRGRWHTEVVGTLIADLEFLKIEPGRDDGGHEAVLWSYAVACGSCHGGPEGVLLWNPKSGRYEWNDLNNEDKAWDDKIASVLSGHESLDETDKLSWLEGRERMVFNAPVHEDEDPHCCNSGGNLEGDVVFADGTLKLENLIHPRETVVNAQ